MRASSLIAGVGLLAVVPLGIIAAYYGFLQGWYPYAALPFVLAGYLLVVLSALFVLLPRLRTFERKWR